MQASKHTYEPIGYESSLGNRPTTARKNLNELFQQAIGQDLTQLEFEIEKYEEIDLDADDDIDDGNQVSKEAKIKNGTSKSSLSNLREGSQYPIEATVLNETEFETNLDELKNSPVRTPSFKTAISLSESGLDFKKVQPVVIIPAPTVSISSSSSHRSKFSSPSSITSLPTSPQTPNLTNTPGNIGVSNPHLSTSILSENGICRICHEGDSQEELVAPCYCAGSVGVLHLTCLERWLGTSNTTRCEICKYQFKVERQARSLWQFISQPAVSAERRNMMCDIICFMILTPLTAISAFLCMMGVRHYAQWDGRWEVPGLAILTSCLLVIYSIWCCVAMRHHYKVCREWQNQNQIIKIKYLSPTKGKAILETKSVDKNHISRSHTSPSHQYLISPCTSTPSPNGPPPFFNRSMLRPILRYSANLDAFTSASHPLDTTFPYGGPSIIWTENELGSNDDRNVLITSCCSRDILKLARETYV